MAFENLFVRTKRSIGGVQLDATVSERHTSEIRLTSNPVEIGADINDHAIIEPKKLSIRGVVTDSPLGFAAISNLVGTATSLANEFFGASTEDRQTRSQQAYLDFLALQEARQPIDIQTGLRLYENMIITGLDVEQDKDTSRAAIIRFECQEVILTESETVSLEPGSLEGDTEKQAQPSANRGRQEPVTPTVSRERTYLKALGDFFTG